MAKRTGHVTEPSYTFISPGTGPRGNRSVLPEREFEKRSKPKPTLGYPETPQAKHGTLIEDDGNGAVLRTRARHDKGSYPSK